MDPKCCTWLYAAGSAGSAGSQFSGDVGGRWFAHTHSFHIITDHLGARSSSSQRIDRVVARRLARHSDSLPRTTTRHHSTHRISFLFFPLPSRTGLTRSSRLVASAGRRLPFDVFLSFRLFVFLPFCVSFLSFRSVPSSFPFSSRPSRRGTWRRSCRRSPRCRSPSRARGSRRA